MTAPASLAALVASRICHDLISPLGAIGNGVELLGLAGQQDSRAEIALIGESAGQAAARVRFFRIAFGAADPGQRLPARDARLALEGIAQAGRLTIDWAVTGDPDRARAKLAFLGLLCLESALAWGGHIAAASQDGRIVLRATAPRLRIEGPLWDVVRNWRIAPAAAALTPAQVQFLLLPIEAERFERTVAMDIGPMLIELRI